MAHADEQHIMPSSVMMRVVFALFLFVDSFDAGIGHGAHFFMAHGVAIRLLLLLQLALHLFDDFRIFGIVGMRLYDHLLALLRWNGVLGFGKAPGAGNI